MRHDSLKHNGVEAGGRSAKSTLHHILQQWSLQTHLAKISTLLSAPFCESSAHLPLFGRSAPLKSFSCAPPFTVLVSGYLISTDSCSHPPLSFTVSLSYALQSYIFLTHIHALSPASLSSFLSNITPTHRQRMNHKHTDMLGYS